MSKILDTTYHTQINNKILPFYTCGVTVMAEYIGWLNKKFNKSYECDDDRLMQILNSSVMIEKARILIKNGIIDESALDYRTDNPKTLDVDESKFTHLNNFKPILAELGNLVTNNDFSFKVEYLSVDEIKTSIDDDYPIQLSAKFTSGGHFVLVVGYDDANNYIVDDPYGNLNTNYTESSIGRGSKLSYNISKLDSIFTFKKILDNIIKYECIKAYKN